MTDRIIVESGSGGVFDVHNIPCGLSVEVRDYDTEGAASDERYLGRGLDDQPCFVSWYEPAIDGAPAVLVALLAAAKATDQLFDREGFRDMRGLAWHDGDRDALRDAIEQAERLTV